jgi:hypothetical protein
MMARNRMLDRGAMAFLIVLVAIGVTVRNNLSFRQRRRSMPTYLVDCSENMSATGCRRCRST